MNGSYQDTKKAEILKPLRRVADCVIRSVV